MKDTSALRGEDSATWTDRVQRFAVIEPEFLVQARRSMEEQALAASRSVRRASTGALGVAGFLVVAAVVFALTGLPGWLTAVGVIAAAGSVGVVPLARYRAARRLSRPAPSWDQAVRIADLDDEGQALLARTRTAIREVLSSRSYREELVDRLKGEMILREREWNIARWLRELTELRALRGATAIAGPDSGRVLRSQEQSLADSHRRTVATVQRLERYAARISRVDAIIKDREAAEAAQTHNDRFNALLADTASDQPGSEEMAGLDGEVTAANLMLKTGLYEVEQAWKDLLASPEAIVSGPPDQP